MILEYMVNVYSFLVRAGRRTVESLPVNYQIAVAENLVTEIEAAE